jgi:hypothetical protein
MILTDADSFWPGTKGPAEFSAESLRGAGQRATASLGTALRKPTGVVNRPAPAAPSG